MKNYIWVVLDKSIEKLNPFRVSTIRKEAREIAKYFNGFTHRTKKARYVVKKYKEV